MKKLKLIAKVSSIIAAGAPIALVIIPSDLSQSITLSNTNCKKVDSSEAIKPQKLMVGLEM